MKWLIFSLVALLATGMFAQISRPIPVINLDANAHTITMQVNCDGDRVTSIETYVDGKYLMTTVLPPPAPMGFRLTAQ